MANGVRKERNAMSSKEPNMKVLAEEVRLIHKELGWVVKHLANIYEQVKTEENLPIDDPNQLKLFQE